MGTLVFQATLGGQVNLTGPNTASTFTISVPAITGTMITSGDTGTVTNTMLAGSIANAKLLNSSVTIGSTSVALGATVTSFAGLTGLSSSSITNSGLTSGRVVYSTTGGLETDSANLLYSGTDLTVYGLTVGRGAGAVSTNTAVGNTALATNTSGAHNVAVGYNASPQSNTGSYNIAIGENSLFSTTSGSNNTALGYASLQSNTTASNNTAVGYQAGYSATTGGNNTFVGQLAGYGVTTGDYNICVGKNAGYGATPITTGTQNIILGYYTSLSAGSNTSSIVIGSSGSGTIGKGSSTGFINPDGGGVYQGNNSLSWSITSDERIKKNIVNNDTGLSVINQIQVRNFEYRLPEEITDLPQNQAIAKQGVQLGVIAQEFQQILPECVKTESTGVMTVNADNLTWYLVNAVKELTARLEALEAA